MYYTGTRHLLHNIATPPPVQEGEADDDDADKRVSVIETSTGNKLTGEEAPMKKDLEQWLQEHPG